MSRPLGFEISELDVQRAVKEHLNVDIDEDKAEQVRLKLDLKKVSDEAAFQSESDGGNGADDDMSAATDRACKEIACQVKEKNLLS